MKFLKRALPIVLAVCLLASLGAVSAIDAGETRTVIGADLTDEQIKTVGLYTVRCKLGYEITADLKIKIEEK